MRQPAIVLAALLLTLGMTAGPATAMEPSGEPAQDHFGCVNGEDAAVAGHPGVAGLADAAARVAELTGDPSPSAWNAVEHAEPIELGSC